MRPSDAARLGVECFRPLLVSVFGVLGGRNSADMSFEQFQRAIVSPALKNVAAHWNAARRDRLVPAWSDIRPAAIAPQLPIVWSYRFDWETGTFVGRLAGEKITRLIGKGFHGLPLSETCPKEEYPLLLERKRRVVAEPCLARQQGVVYRQADRVGTGERIVLPLSDSRERADGVLGATEYKITRRSLTREINPANDAWEWFSLD